LQIENSNIVQFAAKNEFSHAEIDDQSQIFGSHALIFNKCGQPNTRRTI
jgi:hypothetical protein